MVVLLDYALEGALASGVTTCGGLFLIVRELPGALEDARRAGALIHGDTRCFGWLRR